MTPTKSVIEKKCFRCGIVRQALEFYKDKQRNDSLSFYCKVCKKELKRDVTPQQHRIDNYRHAFGITVEDYDRMFVEQSGKCAICGSCDPGPKTHFAVDHDHITNKIRGLLCHHCNIALGMMNDSKTCRGIF